MEKIAFTEEDDAPGAIPLEMIDAGNRGDGRGFAARFSDTADFIAFEGTRLRGRKEIAAFHEGLFASELKGTRLAGDVRFTRVVAPGVAVVHGIASTALPGQDELSPSRDSMPLFVARERDGRWWVEAVQNSRQLTLERQRFLDELDALTDDQRRQVDELLAALTSGARHRAPNRL